MTKNKQLTDFPSDEMMVRRTVRAIQKAIEEDVPEFCQENLMETMNSVRYVRGDKINDNLRNYVVSKDTILISFKRSSWDGRMLVDQKNCITYTITTQQNLAAIPKKKNRICPHFLQSILAIENGDLHGRYEQMALFPIEQFEDGVLEKDYKKIVSGVLSRDSGYHHYVIAYAFEKNELLDVKMILFDKGFNTVSEISLDDFIKSDFTKLTTEQSKNSEQIVKPAKTTKDLVAIKTGIRPELIEFEDEKQA